MKLLAVDERGQTKPIVIDHSKQIGEGATASVYRVSFNNELWAAKIYKPDRVLAVEKLEAMLLAPPAELIKLEDSQAFIQYTWVKFLLKDAGKGLVGFLMPFVDQQSTNSLDTYYDPVLIKRLAGNNPSALSLRLEIAKNLSELIANLHELGHYFIDIKPQNIRVYKDNNKVVLMDCDGYSIKNHHGSPARFPADLISTDFIAPEVLKNHLSPKSLGEDQDRYGLAVILFQLLNRGTHPFQGIVTSPHIQVNTNDDRAALGLYPYGITPNRSVKPRPQSIHDLLLTQTRVLFDQAFTSLERPTAREWQNHFETVLSDRLMVRCKLHPNDVRHIHFKDLGCIGCKIDSQVKASNKASTKVRSYEVKPIDISSAKPSLQTSTNTVSSSGTITSPANSSDANNWTIYGLIVVAILGFLIFSDFSKTNSNSSTPIQTTNPSYSSTTPTPSIQHYSKYASIYVSSASRSVGYSIGNSSLEQANANAKKQCANQIKETSNDQCMKIVSGEGKCLSISRAANGAMGVQISNILQNAAEEAQNACKRSGGVNCPWPVETTFCSE
jgi:serine/threonine protein kinase